MAGLLLDGEAWNWIRVHIRAAEENDLDALYSSVAPCEGSVWMEVNGPRWRLAFAAPGEPSAARGVSDDQELCSRADVGRVVDHASFRILPEGQGQGFATKVLAAELHLYRRWCVLEVHMEAVDDGLVVWPRLGFKAREMGLVRERYDEWVTSKGGGPTSAPLLLRDYPADFLRSLVFLPLYLDVNDGTDHP